MLQDEEPSATRDTVVEEPSAVADTGQTADEQQPGTGPSTAITGGAVDVDADDDAAVCSALFRGLVFFLGCADGSALGVTRIAVNTQSHVIYVRRQDAAVYCISGVRAPCEARSQADRDLRV